MHRFPSLSILVLLLGSLPCLAQESALEPPDTGRYLRWGPLRARPGLEIRDLGYDDNIYVSSTNEIDDYTATLIPKLEGLVLFGDRAFLTFDEKLRYTVYKDNSDQNFTDQLFSTRATFPLNRYGFFVDGTYNRIKERPIDQQDIRADRDEDAFGVGAILQPGWRTEIEIGHSRERLRYSDDDDPLNTIGRRLDRTEDRDALEMRYRVKGRTRLTLTAERGAIEFADPQSDGSDSDDWALLPGANFGEGGALSGNVRFGWRRIDAENPVQPDFDDLVGRAQLAYRPVARTTLRLDARREPGFTVSSTGIFYLNTRADLRAIYYMNRLLGFEASGGRGKVEFPAPAGFFERVDRTDFYELGLRFRLAESALGRRLEYTLRFWHTETDSNLPLQSRSRSGVGLGAVVGY